MNQANTTKNYTDPLEQLLWDPNLTQFQQNCLFDQIFDDHFINNVSSTKVADRTDLDDSQDADDSKCCPESGCESSQFEKLVVQGQSLAQSVSAVEILVNNDIDIVANGSSSKVAGRTDLDISANADDSQEKSISETQLNPR